jgi:hypothetical protein
MTAGTPRLFKKKEGKGVRKYQEGRAMGEEREGNEKEIKRAREMEGAPRVGMARDEETADFPRQPSLEVGEEERL